MAAQQFCLKWNSHTNNMVDIFNTLLSTEALVDVTLACDGLSLKAHKIVLSACSPFFQSLFLENPCQHPIVIMKDISFKDLKAIVDFMYRGEINVSQDQLSALLKTAETLRVKGLADDNHSAPQDAPPPQTTVPLSASTPLISQQQQKRTDSPASHVKRKKGRVRKRSASDSNQSEGDLVPKIKEPNSPEVAELSDDDVPVHETRRNVGGQRTTTPSVRHVSSVSNYSSKLPRSSSSIHVDEHSSVGENEFEQEPAKLLEQTLTTNTISPVPNVASSSTVSSRNFNFPSSSSSELKISQVNISGDGDNLALVPTGGSDSLGTSQLQAPDSPQDIKPVISYDESQSDSMLYDQSSLPGPSGFQDNSFAEGEEQPQGPEEIRKGVLASEQKIDEREKTRTQKQTEIPKKSTKENVVINWTAAVDPKKKPVWVAKVQCPVKDLGKDCMQIPFTEDSLKKNLVEKELFREEIRKKILSLKQKFEEREKARSQKQTESPKMSVKENGVINWAAAVDSKKKFVWDAKVQCLVKDLGKHKAKSTDDNNANDEKEDEDDDNEDSFHTPNSKVIQQKLKTLEQEKVMPKLYTDKATNCNLLESTRKTLKAMELEETTPEKEKSNVADDINEDEEIKRLTHARTLCVRCLPVDITEAELKSLSTDIIGVSFHKKNLRKSIQKMCAFLLFASEAKATANFSVLKNKKLRGKRMSLHFVGEKAKPKKYDLRMLLVTGLPNDVMIAEIGVLFPKANAIILFKSDIATVSFLTKKDAEEALKANQKSQICGKILTVTYSMISAQNTKKKQMCTQDVQKRAEAIQRKREKRRMQRKNKAQRKRETALAPPAKKIKVYTVE